GRGAGSAHGVASGTAQRSRVAIAGSVAVGPETGSGGGEGIRATGPIATARRLDAGQPGGGADRAGAESTGRSLAAHRDCGRSAFRGGVPEPRQAARAGAAAGGGGTNLPARD